MYRCFGCDNPPQLGHHEDCIVNNPQHYQYPDPWSGWKEDARKVDIQSGMKVNSPEEAVVMA